MDGGTIYPTLVCRVVLPGHFPKNGYVTCTNRGRSWSFDLHDGVFWRYPQGLSGINLWVNLNGRVFLPICSDGTDFFTTASTAAVGVLPHVYRLDTYEIDFYMAEV